MSSEPVKLHFVHTYTDVDRQFWAEHLEDWVPSQLIDAHVHIADAAHRIETITEQMKRDYWVMELSESQTAETADSCYRTVYPRREVSCLAFGHPGLGWDIEATNAYVAEKTAARGWHALALVRPTWVAEQVAAQLDRPSVIGVKPYYMMIGYDKTGRDLYIESSIYDFLPHHQLEVLDERAAWVTLHVPRAGRLGHPDNIREIREIRSRYPRIRIVIAHLGRSYTLPHAEEGILPLCDDDSLYFDISAVLNPDVLDLAIKRIGPRRILYGTDNPIFYMRGREQWEGRSYRIRTSYPFWFNKERESPEIEANYTLYIYEALYAIRQACEKNQLDRDAIDAIFRGNAATLIDDVARRKASA